MTSDGGAAFPMPSGKEPRVNETTHYNEGMSLLDYFAGQALVGMLAYPGDAMSGSWHSNSNPATVAGAAFDYAKKMVAESLKRRGGQ